MQLKIVLWNANGLAQHTVEVKAYLQTQNVDIMLISETHFTTRSYIKIPKYTIYATQHPDGTAHGGTAIIIKNSIKHHLHGHHTLAHLQATSITIDDWIGPLTIAAIYCPPKHTIKSEQFRSYYATLGHRFLAGGDYNAKHLHWGSRLTTPRGRELFKAMQADNLSYVSTGEPTHWPSDRRKVPDLLDFGVVKGIPTLSMHAESSLDLSSDHSPVIINVHSKIAQQPSPPSLSTKITNWATFRHLITENLTIDVPLKTNRDVEDYVHQLVQIIQQAAWNSTPNPRKPPTADTCAPMIKQKIIDKRQLRKRWQNFRSPQDKAKLNKAATELKQLLLDHKQQAIQTYLESLSASEATDYSLWKATKRLKRPQIPIPPLRTAGGEWAKSDAQKANVLADHFAQVFRPYDSELSRSEEREIIHALGTPSRLNTPVKKFKLSEVRSMVNRLRSTKAPGYDLITGQILKELPDVGIKAITLIFNSILRIGYFPGQWKVSQIIPLLKPGKPAEEVTSYRPISLLPILSKLFEKLLSTRLQPLLQDQRIIPDHQFGFRRHHATIEQVHRVVNIIHNAMEAKQYCTAAFLDISQAFDKVWHEGLLYKLKTLFPDKIYTIFKSYLANRHFLIKYRETYTSLRPVQSGVPQGSVLGPLLYLLFTADLPTTADSTTATFADDTAILTVNEDPAEATHQLQNHLNNINSWLNRWRMKANQTKSVQVTFTLKKRTCPPVYLNNKQLPQTEQVKYLGIHLDRRLTWRNHITAKKKQLDLKLRNLYWIIGRQSRLSLTNKLLVYKIILKPIWTYGVQLWGSASNSNLEILERFQSKVLRILTNAPWYVPNVVIRRDLKVSTVRQEVRNLSVTYRQRIANHPNSLANCLFQGLNYNRRLKRHCPADLFTRF